MTRRLLLSSLVLLVLISEGRSQFFDFFQGFQPLIQPFTTRRPAVKHYSNDVTVKPTTKRSIAITYIDGLDRLDNNAQLPKEKKRKQTTTSPVYNINFYTTTAKPVRKSSKSGIRNSSNVNSRTSKPKNSRISNTDDATEIKYDTDERSVWFDKPIQNNNIGNDYYITNRPGYESTRRPETTRRPNYATTKRQTTSKPNYNYYDTSDYNNQQTTKRPYHYYDSNQNYQTPKQEYTTKTPYYNRPGVKPAVAENRPPITNKPITTRSPFKVNSKPTDAGAIAFPDEDASPEIIVGPNEDYMSEAEKRRYIDMAERMCDKYKSLSTKRLQAIPLLPSPQPVDVEVKSCAPTNIPLVVGGKVVEISEFPHMALLGWLKIELCTNQGYMHPAASCKDAGYSWKCGGSLVSDQYVLTAAHCAYQERDNTVHTGAPRAVQLGSSYLDDPGALVVKVTAVIRHPKYKQPKSYYDIALVKLASPVTFSEVIRPACLGSPPPVGRPIIATGWGQTEFGDQSHELRSVSLPVWDINDCGNVLGTSRKLPNGPSSDSQMCAGERKGGKDTCQGDSGGPAQTQDGCVWRVVAVTSLGRSCGAPGTPGLYSVVHKAFVAAEIFGGVVNSENESQSSGSDNYKRRNQGVPTNNNYNNNYQDTNNRNENRESNDNNRNREYASSDHQESNRNYRTNTNQQKYNGENTHRTENNRNHRIDQDNYYDSSSTTYNNPQVSNTNNKYDTNRRETDLNYNNRQNNQRSINNNNHRTENYNNNNYSTQENNNGRTDNYWTSYNSGNQNNDQNYNSRRQYYNNQDRSRQYDAVPWWSK